jgi:hypothetical protein
MSLASDITDYRDGELRELHELQRFFKSLSFAAAIEYAASGVTPHKKIHPHQRRIGVKRLRQSATILKKFTPFIRKAKSFADLFVITETVKSDMKGPGDLWSYDTALRMAFNRGKTFYPQAVFVQGAVVEGVKKMFSKIPMDGRTLPIKIFPKEIRQLRPFEVENFLSIWGRKKTIQ